MFQKGQSGNPGGRPKAVQWAKRLAQSRSADYVLFWFQKMDEGGPDAVTAVKELCRIASLYGEPVAEGPMAVPDVETGPVDIEKLRRIARGEQ